MASRYRHIRPLLRMPKLENSIKIRWPAYANQSETRLSLGWMMKDAKGQEGETIPSSLIRQYEYRENELNRYKACKGVHRRPSINLVRWRGALA